MNGERTVRITFLVTQEEKDRIDELVDQFSISPLFSSMSDVIRYLVLREHERYAKVPVSRDAVV